MSSLFLVHYSHLYQSLSSKVQNAVTITAGNKRCVKLAVPSMGFLEKLIVSQVPAGSGGGTSVAFTVELLNSVLPFSVGEHAVATAAAAPLPHHRVQTPADAALSATAGNAATFIDTSYGVGYVNVDGTYTSNQNALYLLISPTSAGDDTKWNITVSGRNTDH